MELRASEVESKHNGESREHEYQIQSDRSVPARAAVVIDSSRPKVGAMQPPSAVAKIAPRMLSGAPEFGNAATNFTGV